MKAKTIIFGYNPEVSITMQTDNTTQTPDQKALSKGFFPDDDSDGTTISSQQLIVAYVRRGLLF